MFEPDPNDSPDVSAVAPVDAPQPSDPNAAPPTPTAQDAASVAPTSNTPPDMPAPSEPTPQFKPGLSGRLRALAVGLLEGGIPGAVVGAVDPLAPARAAAVRNQINTQNVRFATARAASAVAQATADEAHLRMLPDELQAQHDEAAKQTIDTFHKLGLPLVSVVDTQDDGTAAMQGLSTLAKSSPGGQVPHVSVVQMGGKAYVFSLDRAANNLEQVNSLRAAQGLPKYTPEDFNALTPEQRINALDQSARIFSEPFAPKTVAAQIANLQSHRDLYNATTPDWNKDKTGVLARYDARIKEARGAMNFFDARDRQVAAIKVATQRITGRAPDGSWDLSSLPVNVVEGNIDPSQLSKRTKTYDATLQAANEYSMQKYGKPFDVAQASLDYKFATNPATQNTLRYLNSLTGPNNKSGNLGALTAMSDSPGLARTSFPALNKAKMWSQLESGDPNVAAYHAAVTEVADQVSKILQGGGTGSGTSDAKLKQAQELFNSGFNPAQIKSTADTLRTLLSNRKAEMIGDNRYLLRQFGGAQSNAGGTTQSQQQPIFARNPQTGARVQSLDGGKTWQQAQ
ncbi:MAG: hypothetical protein ACRD3E_11600 [Terriglobales bacterium]